MTSSDAAFSIASPLRRIRLVLCQTSHPGNIGAAARAMKTMGLSRLYLVQPRVFPSPEAEARASGATDILASAVQCSSLAEAVADCVLVIGLSARPRELVGQVWSVREAAQRAVAAAGQLEQGSEVALVFGTEMSGLSNEELSLCQALAYIPTNPEYSSLNVAAALQILAYECRMALQERLQDHQRYQAPVFPLATQSEIEGLYQHLESTLTKLGFYNPAVPKRLFPRLRRLFARAGLEKEEVNLWRGILARVDQRLHRSGS